MFMLNMSKKILSFVFLILMCVIPVFCFKFGNGNNESSMIFIKICENVKSVYLDTESSFIIKKDNSLWGTGIGIKNKFEINCKNIEYSYIKLLDDVISYNGLYLTKTDGSCWEVYNGLHKLEKNIIQGNGCLYRTSDNCLWADGYNNHGIYGTGQKEKEYLHPAIIRNNIIHLYVSPLESQIINTDYELYISGEHYLPSNYPKNYKYIKIADNVRYSTCGFYITNNDDLYAFGWCGDGASGLGNMRDTVNISPTKVCGNVKTVVSNQQITLILKKDGKLYGCGGDNPNYQGELGLGHKNPVYKPIYIMSDVKSIYVGYNYAAIIKNDDTLWMCGANGYSGGL